MVNTMGTSHDMVGKLMNTTLDLFEMKYRPGDFADSVGTTTDVIRDWRRRGIDVGLAVSVNGQKNFCEFDRLEFQIITKLRLLFFDSISVAFAISRRITPYIALKLGYNLDGHPDRNPMSLGYDFSHKYALITGARVMRLTSDVTTFMANDHSASDFQPIFAVIDLDSLAGLLAKALSDPE